MNKITTGLFADDDNEQSKDTTLAMQCARKLHNVIKGKQLLRSMPNIKQWATQFDALLKRHGEDAINAALDWYVAHIGEEYTPQAFSAKTFGSKLANIQQQMLQNPTPGKLSEDASYVLKCLIENEPRHWPNGAEVELPQLVERSFQNYSVFWGKLRAWKTKSAADPDKDVQRQLHFLKEELLVKHLLCHPQDFTLQWFRWQHENESRKRNWTDNLRYWLWQEKSERFRKAGHIWAWDWCEYAGLWDDLIASIQKG